jgi:hypothetical protein
MSFPRISASMLVLFAAAVAPIAAQTEPETTAHVYTNADLERFGPPAVDSAPVAPHDDTEWKFVTDFIEREQVRIDAERAYRLEQRRVTIEEQSVEDRRSHGRYIQPYGVYPYGNTSVRHGRKRGRHAGSSSVLGDRIVPLHARPSGAQIQRAKAIRRSGVDAFPSNARKSR